MPNADTAIMDTLGDSVLSDGVVGVINYSLNSFRLGRFLESSTAATIERGIILKKVNAHPST